MLLRRALAHYFAEHVDPRGGPGIVDVRRANAARAHLERHLGDVCISKIDIPLCRSYCEARRLANGPADATLRRELTMVKAAVRHNIAWKRLSRADEPTLEYPGSIIRREVWLFKDELRRLRDARNGDIRDFIDTLYFTGSRRRAIEVLEWSQVDLEAGIIRLAKPGERKTKKRRPTVPIVSGLKAMLTRRWIERGPEPWVFGSDKSRFNDLINTAKSAGVYALEARDGRPAGHFTPHALRHSRATHLLQDGVDIYTVARLLGDTIRTVESTYGHASAGRTAEALERSTL